jgi:WD40 repeat protein
LASGSADTTLRLYDVAHRKELAILKEHKKTIFAVNFSPDSKILASGSADSTIRLYNTETY